MIKKNCFFIFLFLYSAFASGQSSVLSSGSWYKFSVASDGIYKIDFQLLQKAGINPSQINPKNIKIFAGQRGMLPQPNNATRINDLQEVSITVVGEADGKFDAGDLILFYGQSPDNFYFDQKSKTFFYQNNLFTDKNFYFLTISTTPGKRNVVSENLAGSYPVINQYDEFGYYESDKYNLLHSGRQWFGEQFDQTLQFPIQFNVPGIIPNSSITLISHVMAESITDCSYDVSYNSTKILNQKIDAIPNIPYGIKGSTKADTIVFNESTVNGASQNAQTINYQFNKGGPGISIGYLDYILFSFKRTLALYDAQTIFTSSESVLNSVSTYQVNAVSSGNLVWDITDAFNTKTQATQLNINSFLFSTNTNTLKKFVVFDPSKISSATFESTVPNQNLHGISSADLLIISHPSFFDQASRLASFRQSHNQLTGSTVTTEAIYNEYSGGKSDFTAIRDFVRDVFKKSNGPLKYVLL
ncbi:MAG TPA: hypothetical protein DGG95_05010, partial [Cytophagales bacterium]|nr:hypothetical protein [Cytophagales bacterium]